MFTKLNYIATIKNKTSTISQVALISMFPKDEQRFKVDYVKI